MPLFSSQTLFKFLHNLQATQGQSLLRKIRIIALCFFIIGGLIGIYFFLIPFSWVTLIGSLFFLLLGAALLGTAFYLQTKLQTISMLMTTAEKFFQQSPSKKN